MEEKKIVDIGIEHIYPHPYNPRKELGDLSELSKSIMKKGVMQNLTIIPIEGKQGEYTVIIGHRRHAAAKLAGVSEVPCRIVEGMSMKDQMSTMLEENMQRNDLTIFEQAQGFQMMLDLGETEETISEKTGFSRTTIRHRLNIAKLDQNELKKKEQDSSFQMALTDLYALEKVEDIKTRNRILREATNSRELIWKAQNAVYEVEKKKKTKQIANMLIKLGVEKAPKVAETEQYSGKWETVKEISLESEVPKQIKLPIAKETVYYLPFYRNIRIIKRAKKGKKALTPEESARKQRDKDKKVIRDKLKEMNENRQLFIKNIISGKISAVKDENEIREKAWRCIIEVGGFLSPSSMRKIFTGKEDYECTEEERTEAHKKINDLSITHSMLVTMHCLAQSSGEIYDWQGSYRTGTGSSLLHVYEVLRPYGWTFVEEDDMKILDGTHELYVKKEVDKVES